MFVANKKILFLAPIGGRGGAPLHVIIQGTRLVERLSSSTLGF